MTTSMLQDTLQAAPAPTGPRFRPYASPNHHVTKGRYITSNDPRGYIPVYEYPLNGQWIMMDIDDGYILWTGIWKALGNSKADIVKMIDSQPDLAPLIRRVRGGYLKIQGTWMPYEVALRLSRRVAWTIRDDLIPLFGPTFPSTCLSPDQPGYGQVVASGPSRRRARRNTHANSALMHHAPRDAHANWTVVTPHTDQSISRQPISPLQVAPSHYTTTATATTAPTTTSSSFYPHSHDVVHFQQGYQYASSPVERGGSSAAAPHPHDHPMAASPAPRDRGSSVRYSPYSSHAPHPTRRLSSDSRGSLSLEIPALSVREPPTHHHNHHNQHHNPRPSGMENITLPPIQAPAGQAGSQSPYALPPISALEDLRGMHVNDSAAVLQRLRSDDDDVFSEPGRPTDSQLRSRRRSFSSQPQLSLSAADSRARTSQASRSYEEQPSYRSRTPSDSEAGDFSTSRGPGLRLSVPSDASHDGISSCDPSPISPATPRSAASIGGHLATLSALSIKDNRRSSDPYHHLLHHHHHHLPHTGPVVHVDWVASKGPRRHDEIRDSDARLAARRNSDTDSDSHPHRPW
ncbi:hypothetical protein BDZ94DRAFT_1326981 [Collybia nuda]|uniref:HTH APSES-type domain-containing protein n=1 Tax=Collybia nuda TaxID=64659 RepID=A0A9P5XTT6_9AGAR|nr:hypothetical protein BDZ94DRAFT_1326981 [Collybia nuda]